MPTSHCLPNGQLGTNELPVPNVSGQAVTTYSPPAGSRRGVIVFFHGLQFAANQFPVPPSLPDTYNALGSNMTASLCQNLAQLGWVVIQVMDQEDTYPGIPGVGVYNDINTIQTSGTAGTFGARYLASSLHLWDHVYQYVQNTYAPLAGGVVPVIPVGTSFGGWRAVAVTQNRLGSTTPPSGIISNQGSHIFETISALATSPYAFGNINCSGVDNVATSLNATPGNFPGLIQYGTTDTVVFYGGNSSCTVSGTSGSAIVNLGSPPASLGFYTAAASPAVVYSGSTQWNFTYTGVSGNTLTGCTTTYGTIPASGTCVQQYTTSIISQVTSRGTNAIYGNTTAQIHTLSAGDAGFYAAVAGTLSTSGGTITIPAVQGNFTAGVPAIQNGLSSAANGVGIWNGSGWTLLSGCTVSGTSITYTSAAAASAYALNAPIVNVGTLTSGVYSNISIPYYVAQNMNPSFTSLW